MRNLWPASAVLASRCRASYTGGPLRDDDGALVPPDETVGAPKYQEMDETALIPWLTAALQNALTRIATLEAAATP